MELKYLILILFFFTKLSFSWDYCSDLGYCLDVPDSMIVVSISNYQDYSDTLPEKILQEYKKGNKREIIIDKPSGSLNDSSFMVLRVQVPGVSNINVSGTCDAYRRIDGDSLRECGLLPGYGVRGLWALSYNKNDLSYCRVWIELDKRHHVYAVSAEKFRDENTFRMISAGMLKILKTIRRRK
jgi:hypothetical protein